MAKKRYSRRCTIKDIGTYNVVATPTRNGVLHGEAWATFKVVETAVVCGDVDLDGKITISDVTVIQRHIAELDILTGDTLFAADTNGDGTVDITDATHLQKYLAEYDGVIGAIDIQYPHNHRLSLFSAVVIYG